MFKKSNGASLRISWLKSFIHLLEVLPASSADCKRGFSEMNLYHISGRRKPLIYSLSDLLMTGINGPPVLASNAEKYVIIMA